MQKEFNTIITKNDIIRQIEYALTNNKVEIAYQGLFDIHTNSIVGCEALVRLKNSDDEIIKPDEFIPIAEDTGHIIDISRLVFDKVCSYLASNNKKGNPNVPISINLSRLDFYEEDLLEYINDVLNKYRVNPKMITIELTESVAVQDYVTIKPILLALKDLGIKIAIDDFGTGYSSLSVLYDLPCDILKIDRKFIKDLLLNDKVFKVLKCIVALANELQLIIVGEGIETKEQADILKQLKIYYGQGYLYAKPIPNVLFNKMLENQLKKSSN